MNRPLNEMETFRAQELLLQRATEGLDDREAAELADLGLADDTSFDLAAASVDLATLPPAGELPADVAERILIAAGVETSRTTIMSAPPVMTTTLAGFMPPRPLTTSTPPPVAEVGSYPTSATSVSHPSAVVDAPPIVEPPRAVEAPVIPIAARKQSRATTYAVIAAAAAFALAAGAVVWGLQQRDGGGSTPVAEAPSPAEARAALIASAKDVTTLAWTATKDPNALAAAGDVVWSASAQRGYMRFTGLAPNDAKLIQYQLWIFDKDRDQAFPVDGGVFDVSSTGEVIVPITAKLHVDQPVLFAVTIEKPGGVVVSKRERIVVTAAPKA